MNREHNSRIEKKPRASFRYDRALVFAGLLAAYAVPGFAQSQSATVRLVGHIPPQATIQLGTASTAVVTLDLNHPNAEINLLNFTDSTNGGESYSISITSSNLSSQGVPQLVAANGSAAPVPFQLTFDGQALQFRDGVATLKTIGGQSTGNGTGALGLVPLGQAGSDSNYSDTLVFNIVAN